MRKIFSLLMCILLLVVMFNALFHIQLVEANPGTITVPDDYVTIQEAINHANSSDTIFVRADTYYEHIVVNKTLTLIGEDKNTTIIDGNKTGTVITVEATNVRINGFTVRNSGNTVVAGQKYPVDSGIKLNSSIPSFQNVTIADNFIMNNSAGIYLRYSNNNTITDNSFYNNTGPPFVEYFDPSDPYAWPFKVRGTPNDLFLTMSSGNKVSNGGDAARLYNSSSNIIVGFSEVTLSNSHNNIITNCSGDITLSESNDNVIRNNHLLPGKSIQVTKQYFEEKAASNRTIVTGNILTNGSIYVGYMSSLPSSNNTIMNNTIVGGKIFVFGSNNIISLNKVSRTNSAIEVHALWFPFQQNETTISENEIQQARIGINLYNNHNKVESNKVSFSELGILLNSGENELRNNTISNSTFGLYLSGKNVLRENRMIGNNYNLVTLHELYPFSSAIYNDVDTSNTVNGKPVLYLVNQSNLDINPSTFPDVGYLALVNSRNITVSGLTLTNNGDGILLSKSTNCTIKGNTLKNNLVGISADVNSTSLVSNVISDNYHGITLTGDYNRITNNTVTRNTFRQAPLQWPEHWLYPSPIEEWFTQQLWYYSAGIVMSFANNSTIVGNNIAENEHGIFMYASGSNVLKNNNMTNNVYNFGIDPYALYPPFWSYDPPTTLQISPYLLNDVDTSNTIDGKPIYWWVNRHGQQVPADAGFVLLVNSTNMIIKDLALHDNTESIFLVDVNNTIVSNSTITNSLYGIFVASTYRGPSFNNTITNNNISKNGFGVYSTATNSRVVLNRIEGNIVGLLISGNLTLIMGNMITDNVSPPREQWVLGYYPPHFMPTFYNYYPGPIGVLLEGANNTVSYNTLQNNDCGVGTGYRTGRSVNNRIHHNNFINNTQQLYIGAISMWDDGYPSGGNYWSDYTGTDYYHGTYQNETGKDGIGDTPYQTGLWTPEFKLWYQYDHYPLMAPIDIFDVGIWNATAWNVTILSNSVVTNVHFDPAEGTLIRFNVTDENGTAGFCRIAIPRALLWTDDRWTIRVGDEQIQNYTLVQDEKYTYLYFAYNHSTKTVHVIGTGAVPEFPSAAITLLLLTFTTVVAIMRKRLKEPHIKRYVSSRPK